MSDDLTRTLLDACNRAGLCVFPYPDRACDVNDLDVMSALADELAPILDEDTLMAERRAWDEGWRQGANAMRTHYQTGLAMPIPVESIVNPYGRKDTR